MNAHNMFVDVYVRAVITCHLPLLHGLCMLYFYCLLCRIALFHRTNINAVYQIICCRQVIFNGTSARQSESVYSLSNSTISNKKDFNRSSDFLVIN